MRGGPGDTRGRVRLPFSLRRKLRPGAEGGLWCGPSPTCLGPGAGPLPVGGHRLPGSASSLLGCVCVCVCELR